MLTDILHILHCSTSHEDLQEVEADISVQSGFISANTSVSDYRAGDTSDTGDSHSLLCYKYLSNISKFIIINYILEYGEDNELWVHFQLFTGAKFFSLFVSFIKILIFKKRMNNE